MGSRSRPTGFRSLPIGSLPETRETLRQERKLRGQRKIGRPSNARRFGKLVFRLHSPTGTTKREAQRIADQLRDSGFNVRLVSPLVVGDRVNLPKRTWIYKRKRR